MKKLKGPATKLSIDLERRSWHNWVLIVCTAVITTFGLGLAILSSLNVGIVSWWPWPQTNAALPLGLSLVVMAFAGYLTQQQRYLMKLRNDLDMHREASSAQIRKHYERLLAVYT